jgi:hypothetical protein
MKYLIIEVKDVFCNYIVDDLDSFIEEVYEVDLLNGVSKDKVKEWFNNNFKVFEINGEIKELN